MNMDQKYIKTINSFGHVTIPSEVRKLLGLHPKTRVVLQVKDGGIEIRPLKPPGEQK